MMCTHAMYTSSYQAMILSRPLKRHPHFAVLAHIFIDPQFLVSGTRCRGWHFSSPPPPSSRLPTSVWMGCHRSTSQRGGSSPSSIHKRPSNIAFLEIRSYAPTPSMEITVAEGSTSVMNVRNTLTTCFRRQCVLEGSCGCLGFLGDLFGDGLGDKPFDDVPNDDPSHPTIWFTECCEPAESECLDDGVWHIPVRQERPHLGKELQITFTAEQREQMIRSHAGRPWRCTSLSSSTTRTDHNPEQIARKAAS